MKLARRLVARDHDLCDPGEEGFEPPSIRHVDLRAVAELARPFVEGRGESRRTEVHARQAERIQRIGVAVRVQIGCADPLERPRRAAALRQRRSLDEAAPGVDARGVGGGHVGRGRDPREARVLPEHPAPPALHPDDGEVTAHAVLEDERCELRIGHVALDALAPERIRTVEHDHADPRARALLHGERQRPDERVVPGSDVLEIDDEPVEPGQHLRRRRALFAVEAPHREPRDRIVRGGDRGVILGGAPEPVLGREEPHERGAGEILQKLCGMLEAVGDRGLVGEEAEAAPAEKRRLPAHEDLQARFHSHSDRIVIWPRHGAAHSLRATADRSREPREPRARPPLIARDREADEPRGPPRGRGGRAGDAVDRPGGGPDRGRARRRRAPHLRRGRDERPARRARSRRVPAHVQHTPGARAGRDGRRARLRLPLARGRRG